MKQAFWKIPKEWVKDWGLSGYEAIVLADIKAWDKPCTLDERAERCGISKNGVRKALENIAKKVPQSGTTDVPQSVQTMCHKVAQKSTQSGTKKVHKVAFPPHPPIIEEKYREESEEIITPNGVPKADASAVKKKKKNEPSLQHRCRLFFEQIYEQKKGNKYYYSATDANALKQLLQKIRYLMPEDIKDDEQELEHNFQIFIQVICTSTHVDSWVMDNLSLKIINSKFNEIYNQIKNGRTTAKPKQQQQGVTDEYIRRTAEQVAANGGLAF